MATSGRTTVLRAIKIAKAAGLRITEIVLEPDGTVRVLTAEPGDDAGDADLERSRARRRARKLERERVATKD